MPIAKLFARHMKVGEQIQQLQGEARRTRVAVNHRFFLCHTVAPQDSSLSFLCVIFQVGTVNRLLRLLDAGALSLERTRYVVIDMEQTVW